MKRLSLLAGAALAMSVVTPNIATAATAPALPEALVVALQRDLGLSPDEFYAEAASLATQPTLTAGAGSTESALPWSDGSLMPDGGSLEGSTGLGTITKTLGSLDPEWNPETGGVPDLIGSFNIKSIDLIRGIGSSIPGMPNPPAGARVGGDGYLSGYGTVGTACSVGFPIIDNNGDPGFVTAGHCDNNRIAQGTPLASQAIDARDMDPIGLFRKSVTQGLDYGIVRAMPHKFARFGAGVRGEGGTVAPLTGVVEPKVGMPVCTSGTVTGYSCGRVTRTDIDQLVGTEFLRGLFSMDVCILQGDSGGTIFTGDKLVGIINSATLAVVPSCAVTSSLGPLVSSMGVPAKAILDANPDITLRTK